MLGHVDRHYGQTCIEQASLEDEYLCSSFGSGEERGDAILGENVAFENRDHKDLVG